MSLQDAIKRNRAAQAAKRAEESQRAFVRCYRGAQRAALDVSETFPKPKVSQ